LRLAEPFTGLGSLFQSINPTQYEDGYFYSLFRSVDDLSFSRRGPTSLLGSVGFTSEPSKARRAAIVIALYPGSDSTRPAYRRGSLLDRISCLCRLGNKGKTFPAVCLESEPSEARRAGRTHSKDWH